MWRLLKHPHCAFIRSNNIPVIPSTGSFATSAPIDHNLPASFRRHFSTHQFRLLSSATHASSRLIEASKCIRDMIDSKKLDKALEFFHETFEASSSLQANESSDTGSLSRRDRRRGGARVSVPLQPDILVFNSLVRGFVDAGRLQAAFDIVGWMREKYMVQPSEVTWSLLMEGVASHGTRSDWRWLLHQLSVAYPAPAASSSSTSSSSSTAASSSGGWRHSSLLERHSFVRWSLRAAARLAYAAPSEFRTRIEQQAEDTHALAAFLITSDGDGNGEDSESIAPAVAPLTRGDFADIISALRLLPRPTAASSAASILAPTPSSSASSPSASSFAGSDLLDTHWLQACSSILYAYGLRHLSSPQWPHPQPQFSDDANHWLVCAHAMTPEATTHVLSGLMKRSARSASDQSTSSASLSSCSDMLSDILLALHWRASMFALLPLPKNAKDAHSRAMTLSTSTSPSLSSSSSFCAPSLSPSSSASSSSSSLHSNIVVSDLDVNGLEQLLRFLRRAQEESKHPKAAKSFRNQVSHLQQLLSPFLVEPISTNDDSSSSLSFLSRCFSKAQSWSVRLLFSFSHPFFLRPSISTSSQPTWLQIGCKRSYSDFTLELASYLHHDFSSVFPISSPANSEALSKKSSSKSASSLDIKGRLMVIERASPNVAKLLHQWLGKLRSAIFPQPDEVDKLGIASSTPSSSSSISSASTSKSFTRLNSGLKSVFPSFSAASSTSSSSDSVFSLADLRVLARSLRVWFPTSAHLQSAIASKQSKTSAATVSAEIKATATKSKILQRFQNSMASSSGLCLYSTAAEDVTTSTLLESLPKVQCFSGAIFAFPPPPPKPTSLSLPSASLNSTHPEQQQQQPSFMQDNDSTSSVSSLDKGDHVDDEVDVSELPGRDITRRMSPAEFAAWKQLRKNERRQKRKEESAKKKTAKSGNQMSGDSTDDTSSSLLASSGPKEKEWVLCLPTFAKLHERLPAGATVLIITDDEETKVWCQKSFSSSTNAELRAAVYEFHQRTSLSPDFIGQSAEEAGYDAGAPMPSSSATTAASASAASKTYPMIDGFAQVGTITLSSLLKLTQPPQSESKLSRQASRMRIRSRHQSDNGADVADEDVDVEGDDEGDGPEDAVRQTERRNNRLSAHQLLPRLTPAAQQLLLAMAHVPSVSQWADHPHRSHTKLILLQKL